MAFAIGSFTPSILPGAMTLIRADKPNATVYTYNGAGYFSWPPTIIGKIIELSWNLLPAADFAALDVLYQADSPVVFDPDEGDGKTYNVELVNLDGVYYFNRTMRTEVKLSLRIFSVVTP